MKGHNTCPFLNECYDRSEFSITGHWIKAAPIIKGYAKMAIDGVLGSTNKQQNWEVFHKILDILGLLLRCLYQRLSL